MFNQALVAKQGWLLLIYPQSLVARMLEAKYFPTGSFMEVDEKASDSYLWKSFLWGRELLRKGLRWRISNGRRVRVFHDPWVPNMEGFMVAGRSGSMRELSVSDLITDVGGWKEGVLNELFNEDERVAILNIPLVASQAQDIMVWHYNRNGRYYVKSGYWLAMKEKCQEIGGVVDHVPVDMNYWKHLWKLKVPPSLLHFL